MLGNRNPIEYQALEHKHVMVVGTGSVGSTMVDLLARSGIGRICMIDPDKLSEENLCRHILSLEDVGKPKVFGMRDYLSRLRPTLSVAAINRDFVNRNGRPGSDEELCYPAEYDIDLVICCADSYTCQSQVNQLCVENKIPAIFICLWAGATIGEVFYWKPGLPCFECAFDFRRREDIPYPQAKYTDPTIDETRIPGMAGLYANIMAICGIGFQAVLGIFGLRDVLDDRNFWIFNFYEKDFQPFALHLAQVEKGCPVCDG
jgi:molybdopterin/thiamine biosynthesis adenylyltransferase